jgi:hypothetical protein
MRELLLLEVKRYAELLERGEFTKEVKKLGATIRQHSITFEKENTPAKVDK